VNGREHFREAEQLAAQARRLREAAVTGREVEAAERAQALIAEAQVHVLLALAAGLGLGDSAEAADADTPMVRDSGGLRQLGAYLDRVDRRDAES